jgi:hypothetical protein
MEPESPTSGSVIPGVIFYPKLINFFFRFEYDSSVGDMVITTWPSEMHERPATWINDHLKKMVEPNKRTKNYKFVVGANSEFTVKLPSTKVFIPDGFVGTRDMKLFIVVEIANSQTVKSVFDRVASVWLNSPNIRGVIIFKLEEKTAYRCPAASKKPTASILDQSTWFAKDWPKGSIEYDGHKWIDAYFARIVVLIRVDDVHSTTMEVFVAVSLHLNLLMHRWQVNIQPFDYGDPSILGRRRRSDSCTDNNGGETIPASDEDDDEDDDEGGAARTSPNDRHQHLLKHLLSYASSRWRSVIAVRLIEICVVWEQIFLS